MILGGLYPGAILSHRSAFEFKPTYEGQIFLTYSYTKKVNLGRITLRFLEGHKPIEGDNQISGGLYVSQRARAFLENLQPSKNVSGSSKCLTLTQIEDKLEQIIRVNGEEELNKVRDRTREIATELLMEKEFEKLNRIISALLITHTPKILSSPIAVARAFGYPYDPARLQLFENLFRDLKTSEFKNRPDRNPGLLKDKNNFAGLTAFVDFNLVKGTLIQSFDFYKALDHPFAKAAYIMFILSEVHPFLDGNGRIARIMMNSELVKAGQSKIIIPTVYRDDYLGTLRKLTRQSNPQPFISMLKRVHEFSETIYGDNYNEMLDYLRRCNSFSEHTEAKLKIIKS
jgi:fido (protein-threonine AMPylation protein)